MERITVPLPDKRRKRPKAPDLSPGQVIVGVSIDTKAGVAHFDVEEQSTAPPAPDDTP